LANIVLCKETAELFSRLKNFLTGYSQAQFDVFPARRDATIEPS